MSEIDVSNLGGGFRPRRYALVDYSHSKVELSESEKLRDSSTLDTSNLEDGGDPISVLAKRMYEGSVFNVGQPWNQLPGYERRSWYREAARRWLTP